MVMTSPIDDVCSPVETCSILEDCSPLETCSAMYFAKLECCSAFKSFSTMGLPSFSSSTSAMVSLARLVTTLRDAGCTFLSLGGGGGGVRAAGDDTTLFSFVFNLDFDFDFDDLDLDLPPFARCSLNNRSLSIKDRSDFVPGSSVVCSPDAASVPEPEPALDLTSLPGNGSGANDRCSNVSSLYFWPSLLGFADSLLGRSDLRSFFCTSRVPNWFSFLDLPSLCDLLRLSICRSISGKTGILTTLRLLLLVLSAVRNGIMGISSKVC